MTDRRRPERDGRERLDPRVALVLLPVTTEVEGQHFGGGGRHMLNEGGTRPEESWQHRSIWSWRREVSELDVQREPRMRTPRPAAPGPEGGGSVTSRGGRTATWQTAGLLPATGNGDRGRGFQPQRWDFPGKGHKTT